METVATISGEPLKIHQGLEILNNYNGMLSGEVTQISVVFVDCNNELSA